MRDPEALPFGPRLLLAALGLGFSPVAPGSVGALATAALLAVLTPHPPFAAWVAVFLALAATLVTLRWAGRAKRPDGRGDPGWVVSDEVVGQALASAAVLPLADPWAPLLAFVLFRVFDIFKPWPVGRLERLPGGLGVLLDDVAAGVLAAALVGVLVLLGVIA